jgi:hypothetical protein
MLARRDTGEGLHVLRGFQVSDADAEALLWEWPAGVRDGIASGSRGKSVTPDRKLSCVR